MYPAKVMSAEQLADNPLTERGELRIIVQGGGPRFCAYGGMAAETRLVLCAAWKGMGSIHAGIAAFDLRHAGQTTDRNGGDERRA